MSVTGRRPTATSTWSNSRVSALLLVNSPLIVTFAACAPVFSIVSTLVLSAISTPCFLRMRPSVREISRSVPVRSCGIASTTSTFAPMRAYTVANSRPITPPPTISRFFGMRLMRTASSLLTITSPSCGHAFTSIGAEPVAMTIACAVYSSVPPSRFFSETEFALVNEASPYANSTLFALNSWFTPPTFAFTTLSAKAATPSRSTSAFGTLRPSAPACSIWREISPTCNSAFVGMQPQLRHTPPTSSRSKQTTLFPSCPSRIAA